MRCRYIILVSTPMLLPSVVADLTITSQSCTECSLAADPITQTISHTPQYATISGSIVPTKVFKSTVYILYNTYSINWAYSSNGSCITTKGPPVAPGTEFSYTVTAGENPSEVQYLGLSSFREVLGLFNCYIGKPSLTALFSLSPTPDSPTISFSSPDPSTSTSITSPVANVTSSPDPDPPPDIPYTGVDVFTSTSITSPGANVTSSPDPDPPPDIPYTGVDVFTSTSIASPVAIKDLSRGQEAAFGAIILLGITALLVLALFVWQRKKKQRVKEILGQTVPEGTTEDNPPFLQPKPELQGEDSRHEMPAEDRRFELDEDNARYEIMTEEQNRRMNVQVQQQELRGEEFAVEIDDRDTRAECWEHVT